MHQSRYHYGVLRQGKCETWEMWTEWVPCPKSILNEHFVIKNPCFPYFVARSNYPSCTMIRALRQPCVCPGNILLFSLKQVNIWQKMVRNVENNESRRQEIDLGSVELAIDIGCCGKLPVILTPRLHLALRHSTEYSRLRSKHAIQLQYIDHWEMKNWNLSMIPFPKKKKSS